MFKFSSLFSLLLFASIPFMGIAQDCSIDNIIVEQYECNDGFFYVDIAIEASNTGEEGYNVHGNGTDYGNFSYTENYITLGPLAGDGTTVYEFVVTDNIFPNCSDFVEFGTVDCPPAECNLSELVLDFQNCNEDGSYNFILNFDYANTNNLGFDLYINGEIYEYYSYADLPVSLNHIGPFNTDYFSLQVCENDNPNCCIGNDYLTPDCPVSDDCHIDNVIVEAHPCNEEGYFLVDIEVQAVNYGTQGFSVHGNGTDYGDFSYEETFITIGPLLGDGTTGWEFIIADNEFDNCTNYGGLEPFDCTPNDCGFTDIQMNFEGCNDDGSFNYNLNFTPLGNTNEFFDLYVNNEFYGHHPYAELPFYIEGIGPINEDVFVIQICDNDNPDCCTLYTVETPNCGNNECGFEGLTFNFEGCNDLGSYNYTLNFDPVNNTNEYFDFYVGNEFFGNYAYAELPVFLYGVGPFNDNTFHIKVCDNDNPDCCATHTIETPDCGGNDDCVINHVTVEAYDCNEEGYFYVDLAVIGENFGEEGYSVVGNGNDYGDFSYNEPFITLGPFAGDGTTVYEFVVIDNQYPDCSDYAILEPIDCNPGDCGFNDISFHFEGCNDDGAYNFTLNFIPINTTNNYFDVFINNEFYGYFEYESLAVFIEDIGPFDTEYFVVKICDNDNPDCCQVFEVMTPECNNNGDCNIWDVVVEPHIADCDNEIFSVDVAFNSTNTGPLGYYIFANGDIFGPFSYNLPFATIGPFNGDGETPYDFLILDVANPACYAYHEFGTFECDDDVWPGDNNSDNIANHFDLLNIGIAFGFEGPERDDDNTEWDAMPALNWNHFFEDNTNFKHADSDGNGFVDENDITAIYQNYNFTHGDVETFNPPTGTEIDPPVYLDVPDNITTGSAFQIPIMLGTEGETVDDIYGIAFSIELDPELINISNLSVEFPTSWMGEPGINVITLDRFDSVTNILDIAISRTDHNNVSGYGPVVILHGIIDDIAGIHEEVDLRATYINAIDFAQNPIPLNNPFKTSVISKTKDTEAGFVSLMRDTWVVPNPASDVIRIMNKKYIQVEAMAIYNMSGVQIGETFENTNEISIAHLPAGLYTLKLNMGGHVINKKLVKVER